MTGEKEEFVKQKAGIAPGFCITLCKRLCVCTSDNALEMTSGSPSSLHSFPRRCRPRKRSDVRNFYILGASVLALDFSFRYACDQKLRSTLKTILPTLMLSVGKASLAFSSPTVSVFELWVTAPRSHHLGVCIFGTMLLV